MKKILTAMVTMILCVGWAQAQTTLINSGDWFVDTNWDNDAPTATDTATIGNDLAGEIGAAGAVANLLNLADSLGAGTLDVTAGDLTVNTMVVGADSGGNVGTVNQSGGSVTINSGMQLGNTAGLVGVYNLSGGTLSGTIDQIGRYTGGSAELNISGTGSFEVGNVEFSRDGGNTEVNMTGGYFEANHITLARNSGTATFNISGGHLDTTVQGGVFTMDDGGTATMNISGTNAIITLGHHFVTKAGNTLEFVLADVGVTTIYNPGQNRTATLGGTLNIGGFVPIGGAVTLINFGSLSGEFDEVNWQGNLSGDVVYDTGSGQVRLENVIPEPSTSGLLVLGVVSLIFGWRRRFFA